MNAVVLSGGKILGSGGALYSVPAGSGGATLVFNFTNFAGSPGTIHLANSAVFSGNDVVLHDVNPQHSSAGAWYTTQQTPNTFTTTFSFTPSQLGSSPSIGGMYFCVQNTVSPPGFSSVTGTTYAGDANMCGYGGAYNQNPPIDSIAVKFDASALGGTSGSGGFYPLSGGFPSNTGLYLNGGAAVQGGSSLMPIPFNDLVPYGINFYSGDTFTVTIVYDGSLLTMTILDTTTGAQAREVWPLNLANTTNQNGNFVGFVAGAPSSAQFNIHSWEYWSGYNTRLATPTFSPTPGQYSGTQTVTISFPAGSTCYYTTNGLLPTSSSAQYTGPITVNANAVIQAVAIESGFTDSLVATGVYKIGTSNTINFPGGFSANNLVSVGYAYLNSGAYRVTDTNGSTCGAVWFPAPVTISSFTTSFELQWGGSGQGMGFVIQNNPPIYQNLSGVQITGTGGQISFNACTPQLAVGQYVTISGTFGGSGSISGYSSPTSYYVSATNGTTTATLQAPNTSGTGSALTTTVGTPTGLTYTQNSYGWSGGPTVVGSYGNAQGYGGMDATNSATDPPGYAFGLLNSVGLIFNQFAIGSDPSNGVGLYTNGQNPWGAQLSTGLTFSNGHVFTVALTYSGTSLALTMTDNTTLASFSHTFTINISTIVGAGTAYVGFVGGSGGAAAVAAITSWTGF